VRHLQQVEDRAIDGTQGSGRDKAGERDEAEEGEQRAS